MCDIFKEGEFNMGQIDIEDRTGLSARDFNIFQGIKTAFKRYADRMKGNIYNTRFILSTHG